MIIFTLTLVRGYTNRNFGVRLHKLHKFGTSFDEYWGSDSESSANRISRLCLGWITLVYSRHWEDDDD